MKPEAQRYMLLDAMRGVAALAVVWGHLMGSWRHEELTGPQYILAVDFFFILSGFVIAHAYGERMKRGMSPFGFTIIRAIRLYPLLMMGAVFGTIALFILFQGRDGYEPAAVLASGVLAAFALPSFLITVTPLAFPINGPAWSLFFELAVNFLYAFIARHITLTRLMFIALVSGVAVAYFSIQNGTIEGGWQKDGLKEGAARVMFGFFAGILAYQLRPKTPAASWWGYILLAGLAISLMEPIQTNVWGQLALAIVFFPALVWLGSAVRETPFMARAGAFLGALSYPVYILHWPFVDVTRNLFRMIDPADQWFLVWAVIQLALVVSIAWFALKLFDEPVRASLMRRLRWSSFLHKPAASHAPST